ncbi:alkaline phosphatase PhoX, partial [Streptomyces sp.]
MALNRRDFARRSAGAGAGLVLTGAVGALATAPEALAADEPDAYGTGREEDRGKGHGHRLGYGPLVADPDGLLALPEGFAYRVLTRSGVTRLESGEFTPSNHDGTAAFAGPRGTTYLVNNHELKGPRSRWTHPVPLTEGLVYDPAAAGGCTVVEVHRDGTVAEW